VTKTGKGEARFRVFGRYFGRTSTASCRVVGCPAAEKQPRKPRITAAEQRQDQREKCDKQRAISNGTATCCGSIIGGEYGLSASLFRKAARPELGPDLGIFDGAGAVHR
jgi:hypothetical protein